MANSNWTDERVEILKRLWNDGLSASQIANELGGINRNAVIGKVHRLNLSGRAKPASGSPRMTRPRNARKPVQVAPGHNTVHKEGFDVHKNGNTVNYLKIEPEPAQVPQLKSSPPLVPIEDLIVPISLKVSLLALNDQMCKWPIGDPPDRENFHFCGHRNYNNLPYCEYHSRLAYQPVNDRRRGRSRERDAREF